MDQGSDPAWPVLCSYVVYLAQGNLGSLAGCREIIRSSGFIFGPSVLLLHKACSCPSQVLCVGVNLMLVTAARLTASKPGDLLFTSRSPCLLVSVRVLLEKTQKRRADPRPLQTFADLPAQWSPQFPIESCLQSASF